MVRHMSVTLWRASKRATEYWITVMGNSMKAVGNKTRYVARDGFTGPV